MRNTNNNKTDLNAAARIGFFICLQRAKVPAQFLRELGLGADTAQEVSLAQLTAPQDAWVEARRHGSRCAYRFLRNYGFRKPRGRQRMNLAASHAIEFRADGAHPRGEVRVRVAATTDSIPPLQRLMLLEEAGLWSL